LAPGPTGLGREPSAFADDPPPHASQPSECEFWEQTLRARLAGTPSTSPPLEHARLLQLVKLFGLSDLERDIVAALWTASQSPAWRAELASRDVFPGHITVMGLSQCFGPSPRAYLPSESPLRLWRIVTEQPFIEGTAAIAIDAHVIAWLNGEPELDRYLVGRVRPLHPTFELPSWNIAGHARRIVDSLSAEERLRIRICTEDMTCAQQLAAALAGQLGLLALEIARPAGTPDDARERAIRVQRQAFLDECIPCWHATDTTHAWPLEIPAFPVQFVLGTDRLPPHPRMRDIIICPPEPGVEERRALWLATLPAASQWPSETLDGLALRMEASVGEIARAAAAAPSNAEEAAALIRENSAGDLGDLARRTPCPFTWNDLVVPQAVRERLEDFTFEARERARLWQSAEAARLYPQGRGLIALLSGPPGTGKTMSAQVIAADLGLELLRVDISKVLSKWVGETAQHLQRVLSSAASRRAVLLFDEADALFGKRIEDTRQAQDHFINLDISHLMVALENYSGIVLLATNLKSNIDAAFVRRIRYAIEFNRPDVAAREAIWMRVAHALFGESFVATNRAELLRVARIEATGAQIKNAALSAAFSARRTQAVPNAALLGQMLARELAKDGAGLSARELAVMLDPSTPYPTHAGGVLS